MRTETGREKGHSAQAEEAEDRMHVPPNEECVPQGIRLYLKSNVTAGVIDRRTDQPLGGGFTKGSSQNTKEVDRSKMEKEK